MRKKISTILILVGILMIVIPQGLKYYSRQVENKSMQKFKSELQDKSESQDEVEDNYKPVSYTHLDVYKRQHNSLYNKDIFNYIYNIDKYDYDKCFLFCELDKEKKEFKEIINVFSNTSIKELNIVMFK